MKTIVTTLLLAGALIAGACSRSDDPAITAAPATPTPKAEAEPVTPAVPEITPGAPQDQSPAPMTSGSDSMTGPGSGIGIEVVSSSGHIIVAQAQTNAKGAISVDLPGPGTYLVRYTSGPAKGQVIRTINATEAGSVDVLVRRPSAAP